MERQRINERKFGGQEEGREKESEGDQDFLLLSLLFLFRGLLLLFLGVFLIFFSVGIRGAGGKGYVSGEKLSGSIQMAGKPLNLCCPVQKNFNLFFAIGMFLKV